MEPESPPLVFTKRFLRQWRHLAPPAYSAVEKALQKLERGAGTLKALTSYVGLYEMRAPNGLRIILERCEAGPGWVIRAVGDHDPILRRP